MKETKLMKKKYEVVRTRFARPVRFNLIPGAQTVPFRFTETTRLDLLKERLLRQLLEQYDSPTQNAALRRASNDAAALAWATPYPLLVFPALLEEKAQAALRQSERQVSIRSRSLDLMPQAA